MHANDYSVANTKLANQRTYLAYVRTGFIVASLAGIYKRSLWILLLGLLMIFGSTYQYYTLNMHLNSKEHINHTLFDNMAILYLVLSIGVFILDIQTASPPAR